ncbi:MAG: hypothetical protein E6G92_12050 [Alphaproteobacteria bacterium]|nr:MAG: hypothetical protein E6G92_12050 [Alphaproteobacteria bacterium]
MILVAALLLAQASPAVARPNVPHDGVEIPNPIAPPVERYMLCLRREMDQRGGMSTADRQRYRDAVEDSIDACGHTRRTTLAEADRLLSRERDYRESAYRAAEVHRVFRESEQQMRDMPEILDEERRYGAGAAARREAMAPIDIPYQIMPAFQTYAACVSGRLNGDPRFDGADPQMLRQANQDALAGCREVRAQQLARALELQTDNRLYGGQANAQAAVRRAFDRFDSDYLIEATVPATPGEDAAPKDK